MTTVHRVFNFSAGPAVMPLPVLEQIQRDLLALARRRHVDSRGQPPVEDVRVDSGADGSRHPRAGGIPSNYRVLFLQGGASLQFSMVPMNLLGDGATADYIDTRIVGGQGDQGSQKGRHTSTWRRRPRRSNYTRIPRQSEITLTPGAAYVHMTSNNTIEGHASGRRCRTPATCRSSATRRRTCSAVRSTCRSTR